MMAFRWIDISVPLIAPDDPDYTERSLEFHVYWSKGSDVVCIQAPKIGELVRLVDVEHDLSDDLFVEIDVFACVCIRTRPEVATRTPIGSAFFAPRHKRLYTLDIIDPCDGDRNRGSIQVRMTHVPAHMGRNRLPLGRHALAEYGRDWKERFISAFRGPLVPSSDDVRSQHVPFYMTRIGAPLPAAAFLLRVTPSPPAWRSHLGRMLEYALEMEGWTDAHFVRVVQAQLAVRDGGIVPEFARACKIVASAVCILPSALPYYRDHATTTSGRPVRMLERFIDILITLAGDCEDSSRLCYKIALNWMAAAGDGEEGGAFGCAAKLLRLYVPIVVTGEAMLPKAKERASGGDEDSFICHIYGLLVPMHYFLDCVERGSGEPRLPCPPHYRPYGAWERGGLEVLLLEGTTPTQPMQKPLHELGAAYSAAYHALEAAEAYRDSLEGIYPALRKLAIEVPQRKRNLDHGFYRKCVGAWCGVLREWWHRPYIDLAFAVDRTYGVPFSDIVYRSPGLSLVPTFTMRAEEWELVDRVLDHDHPQPAPERSDSGPGRSAQLEARAFAVHQPREADAIIYRAHAAQALDPDVLSALATCVKAGHIASIEYRIHSLWPSVAQIAFYLYRP